MADYKELLRRAISALPENNGAARRAVYEKARSALVGQLRAIQPPLPARDITQHRLQLEDCIRQVEQEASEAIINLGRDHAPAPRPAPVPKAPVITPAAAAPAPVPTPEPPRPEPVFEPEPEEALPAPSVVDEAEQKPSPTDGKSIEEIIALAAETSGATLAPFPTPPRATEPAPTIAPATLEPRRPDTRPSLFTPRREPAAATIAPIGVPQSAPRIEPSLGATALARQPATEPAIITASPAVETALSSVREVEVEDTEAREAEGVIERAIETLDREARGEATEALPHRDPASTATLDDTSFTAAEAEPRSGAGLTIFLVVFALLLVGVGGAGFWAWREGYVDLDQMFGRSQPAVTETAQTPVAEPVLPNMDAAGTDGAATTEDGTAGPGNTATTTVAEPTTALQGLEAEDRLEPTPEAVTPTGGESVLPSLNGEVKTEERLSGADTSIAATDDPAASVDPAVLAGNQSLLLEAATNGQGGAVPFSGTVDWSEGVDEIGLPTLVGKASIPARNLGVTVTIRKNSDPVLPASHLMEISFDVPDTFVGGSIATLAGVLLKDEELVPGTALAGAAARVVGNSFLFALSATPDDLSANLDLLDTRRWLDLAVIYGTGRNAILTLEKDDDAQALFGKVITAWKQ